MLLPNKLCSYNESVMAVSFSDGHGPKNILTLPNSRRLLNSRISPNSKVAKMNRNPQNNTNPHD